MQMNVLKLSNFADKGIVQDSLMEDEDVFSSQIPWFIQT